MDGWIKDFCKWLWLRASAKCHTWKQRIVDCRIYVQGGCIDGQSNGYRQIDAWMNPWMDQWMTDYMEYIKWMDMMNMCMDDGWEDGLMDR